MAENTTANSIAQMIASSLEEGETILWCGMTDSGSTAAERGQKPVGFILLAIFPIVAVITLVPFITQRDMGASLGFAALVFGMMIMGTVMVSLIRMVKRSPERYAITDRRFLLVSKNGLFLRNVRLERLFDLNYTDSGRQIGYVYARVVRTAGSKDNLKTRFIEIRGIRQPAVVYKILWDAIVKDAKKRGAKNRPAAPINGLRDLIG